MVRCMVPTLSDRKLSKRRNHTRIKASESPKDFISKPRTASIVVIQTDDTKLRVNAAALAKFSHVFRHAIQRIPPLCPRGACPVLEVEESPQAMHIFLSFFFNRAYTPHTVDEIAIAINLSKRYQLSIRNPVQDRIFQFLYDTYPTTVYKLDKLQNIDPHFRDYYWLQSEACFRLANTLYLIRQEQGATHMINTLLFTVLLCCARRSLQDINEGVFSADRRRWFKLEDDLRLYIVLLVRPKIDELAFEKTYAFLWWDEYAPSMSDAHKECINCLNTGSSIPCQDHQSCELYREFLRDEVSIFLESDIGYNNALWHFPRLVGGTPINGVNCCDSCRCDWVESIRESRSFAVDELLDVYIDAWEAHPVPQAV